MDVTAIVVATAALFIWGLISNRLERADVTAPIAFVVVGLALAGLNLVSGPEGSESLTPLVELTLVWVLFSDAARLPVQELRRDTGRYLRLLAVGLPLTILLGCGWPCSSARHSHPPTPPSVCRSSRTRSSPHASGSSSPWRAASTTASPRRW